MTAKQHSLERRAFTLGSANAIDYGLQFLLPIVLTRALDAQSFGEYRLLWLAASTLMVIVPMFMSESLYYFLPRSDPSTRRLYVHQTLLWLVLGGLVAGLVTSTLDPLLPEKLRPLVGGHAVAVPLFVGLWIVSYLLDVLPTVEERVGWQANVIVSLSVLRTAGLSAVALETGSLGPVLWTLAAFTAIKVAILLGYIARRHGVRGPWLRTATFAGQVRHAAPFGLSGMLHGLRTQADQWVAAAIFPVAMFASFSIATVMAPMVQLFRKSVNHVFLPSMSRSHSEGDMAAMLALNSRANAMVALLVYPLLAFAFVFAESLIVFVYTPTYLDAVPVLRVYIVGLLVFVVELNSVLLLLKQGTFSACVNVAMLAMAVLLSYVGSLSWGLPGAALGSVTALYCERVVSLTRIARIAGTPVGSLQDWVALAGILAASALAASIAGAALGSVPLTPFSKLAAGTAILALVYPLALFVTGQRRELANLIASLRHAPEQPAIAK